MVTRIAILDPAHGIAGDMCLGALLDLGLDPDWLRALPQALGLDGVTVRAERVLRAGISAWKVDLDIPPQPHGRHLKHIRTIVEASAAPDAVKGTALQAFSRLTEIEAAIHGTTPERVHLHEVGAVDAIVDVVGTIWGLARLGVQRVYATTVTLGDGYVDAAHGRMAVPTPATLRALEGIPVRLGPDGAGELTTPTGAILVRVLSQGAPPAAYTPVASGYGAGSKDPSGRANVLRIILADEAAPPLGAAAEPVTVLAADLDDASGESVAAAAERLRREGALDVVLLPTVMKKGRPGTRVEVLCTPADADRLEALLLTQTSTIGVRRSQWTRTPLPRAVVEVTVLGHAIRCKVVTLPGGSRRGKPESDDVRRVADAIGAPWDMVSDAARRALHDALADKP